MRADKYITYMLQGWIVLFGLGLVVLLTFAFISLVAAGGAQALFTLAIVLTMFGLAPVLGYLVTDWAIVSAEDIRDNLS